MHRDIKEVWAAAAVIVSLIIGGVQLIASAHPNLGIALIGSAGVLILISAWWFFIWPLFVRRATTRVVEWLGQCGDYATTELVNASIASEQDAQELKTRFNQWHTTLIEGAAWYCLPSDASRLRFLDLIEIDLVAPDSGPGWQDGHMKRMAADLVQRIRDLARRLDQDQTRLRRFKRRPS